MARTYKDIVDNADDVWVELGRWFGYPECCIKAFCRFEHMGDDEWRGHYMHGTGFVPCVKHRKWEPADMVKLINEQRECRTRFMVVADGRLYR